jgi:hypothetical protein
MSISRHYSGTGKARQGCFVWALEPGGFVHLGCPVSRWRQEFTRSDHHVLYWVDHEEHVSILLEAEHAHIMLETMATSPHVRITENNAVAATYDWTVVARQIVLKLLAASVGSQSWVTQQIAGLIEQTPCCLNCGAAELGCELQKRYHTRRST